MIDTPSNDWYQISLQKRANPTNTAHEPIQDLKRMRFSKLKYHIMNLGNVRNNSLSWHILCDVPTCVSERFFDQERWTFVQSGGGAASFPTLNPAASHSFLLRGLVAQNPFQIEISSVVAQSRTLERCSDRQRARKKKVQLSTPEPRVQGSCH